MRTISGVLTWLPTLPGRWVGPHAWRAGSGSASRGLGSVSCSGFFSERSLCLPTAPVASDVSSCRLEPRTESALAGSSPPKLAQPNRLSSLPFHGQKSEPWARERQPPAAHRRRPHQRPAPVARPSPQQPAPAEPPIPPRLCPTPARARSLVVAWLRFTAAGRSGQQTLATPSSPLTPSPRH